MSQPREPAPRVPNLGEFRLGEWSVRQAEGTLSMDGRSVRLEPRVMDVLACLAAEPGRVVSKEDLLAAVWDGAFIDEGGLSQAIHGLRKALGDDARQPRYIQTVPKRGYRLVGPVVQEPEPPPGERSTESPPVLVPGSVHPTPPILSGSPRRWYRLILVAAVGLAMVVVLWQAWGRGADRQDSVGVESHRPDRQEGPSAPGTENNGVRIIVLPFQDIGTPEDPHFTAGLTEEIIANLTLLPTVQVIPGRNVLGDEGVAKPISEIGDELEADYVLQGRVNWLAGRQKVRVVPQLIKVTDETIVPTLPFEGNAHRLFTAQQEISRAVISILDITLTPEQSRGLGQRSTRSPEAYRAYIQGLVLNDQPFYSPPQLEKATQMFQLAVDIDPGFAEAWAELSQVHSQLAYNTDRSSKRKEQARQAMERAAVLGPDLVATHLAQAFFSYRCLNDYVGALEHLEAAARMAPNLAKVHDTRGLLLRRLGRLREAIEELKSALELNPRSVDQISTVAETYGALRDYEQADAYFERAISLAPDKPFFYEQRALNRLAWTGNLAEARAILEDSPVRDSPELQFAAVTFDLYERQYQQALARLSVESSKKLSPADQTRLSLQLVIARKRLGDHRGALALAEASLPGLRLRKAQYSRHPIFDAYLAVALAQLGRREMALAQAEQAVQQSRHDAFSGPRFVEIQAMVDAILGRREAVTRLRWLLSTPYRDPISIPELRLDPVWDPLRGSPEFEALLR